MSRPMPSQIQALLDAVPNDPLAAFALADCLDEQGDAELILRGELLRLVYTLTRTVEVRDRARQEDRLRTLLRQGVRAIGPYRQVDLGQGVLMEFAWVPPGAFLMGSPEGEEGREPDEGPQHHVTLTRGFWLGRCPVTFEQYGQVMSADHPCRANRVGANRPVDEVTWHDAVAFLERLSRRVGEESALAFRLPSEAEWEYACRAGTSTRFWSGDGEADLASVAWFTENSHQTQPVGKATNGLGLYDMHGNVWEWCQDWYDPDYYAQYLGKDPCRKKESKKWHSRVVRGGDGYDPSANCRSASRDEWTPECSHNDLGIRVVGVQAASARKR